MLLLKTLMETEPSGFGLGDETSYDDDDGAGHKMMLPLLGNNQKPSLHSKHDDGGDDDEAFHRGYGDHGEAVSKLILNLGSL